MYTTIFPMQRSDDDIASSSTSHPNSCVQVELVIATRTNALFVHDSSSSCLLSMAFVNSLNVQSVVEQPRAGRHNQQHK